MQKFHITIKNNETDEIFIDTDTCAIIGAYDEGEEGTAVLISTKCDGTELAATATGAMRAANQASQTLPKFLQDVILQRVGLKRKASLLEQLFGKKGGKA